MKILKVFIVEDNAIEIGGFMAMVEEHGYTVIGCSSDGADAVRQLQDKKVEPDVILMDIDLPILDGFSASKQIASFSNAPVIIITGYKPDKSMVFDGKDDNIFGYIQKPVDPFELCTSIQIAFNRAEVSHALQQELSKKKQEMEDRKIIEQAKGIIMRFNDCSEQEALQSLQKRSRATNCKLIMVAKMVLESSKNLNM